MLVTARMELLAAVAFRADSPRETNDSQPQATTRTPMPWVRWSWWSCRELAEVVRRGRARAGQAGGLVAGICSGGGPRHGKALARVSTRGY